MGMQVPSRLTLPDSFYDPTGSRVCVCVCSEDSEYGRFMTFSTDLCPPRAVAISFYCSLNGVDCLLSGPVRESVSAVCTQGCKLVIDRLI